MEPPPLALRVELPIKIATLYRTPPGTLATHLLITLDRSKPTRLRLRRL